MIVKKSDGSVQEFEPEKIKHSICEAFGSIGEECNEGLIKSIIKNLYVYDKISSQEIRRQIEESLMSINKKVAKSYIQKFDEVNNSNKQLKKDDDFIRQYIHASNASTGSKYDSNANVESKNVVTLGQELHKGKNIQQNRYIMHNKIKSLYTKKLADQYIKDLESHVLYKHDESGTPGYPYCVAITMYPFLLDGLKNLGGQSVAPTDLKSFCGEFINLVYSISSQFMGACLYKDQVINFVENDIPKAYRIKDFVEKYLKDEDIVIFENYQGTWEYCKLPENIKVLEDGRLVDVLKVYRRKYDSDIYKISTKDGHAAYTSKDHVFKMYLNGRKLDVKAEQLQISDTVFMNKDYSPLTTLATAPNDKRFNTDAIENIEIFKNDDEYVYEIETSSHWYNCGGFLTHNCATPEFLMYMDYFIRKDYGDDYLTKLSEKVEINTKGRNLEQVIENSFQQVVHSMNMPAGNRGYQTVFWNIGYFDKNYFDGIFGDFKFPDGTKPIWETLSWLQKKFMKWFNEERTKYILTFPVETMAMLTDGHDVVDKEYADFTAKMWAEGHSFFCYLSDSPDSLSSCCRLRNSLKDTEDEEHNHTTHQFSMGTASVATGSKSVMTINLNRVIQNATRQYFKDNEDKPFEEGKQVDINTVSDKEKLYEYISKGITEITERVHKYQRAFNEIIKDFYNANMLDVYSAGFISLKKQYLTVGVNGLTDAAEFLNIEPNLNENYEEFVNLILETINKSNKKDKTRDCMYNTEFVPGENLSNKNYNWDKKDGYYVSPKHIMYSSYFFNPEDTSLSVLDKMKLHGNRYVKYLDGGQAAHLNLNEHLSFEQYRQLLKVASEYGCSYYTFNIKNSICNDCSYISKDTIEECPKCGSKNIDYLTRIIGYLKRVSSFSEPRQKEEGMRYYHED